MRLDQFLERHPSLDRVTHQGRHYPVGLPKGHPLLDQPFGQIGGGDRRPVGSRAHPLEVEGDGVDHSAQRGEGESHLVESVEQWLLIFLQVTVVGEGKPLQRCKDSGEVPYQAPGLSPHELGNIRVLLLREHRTAGGVGVVQYREPELFGRPQHELLADA
jgi:hypothetical protein